MKTAKEILKEVKDKNQGELSFIYWPNTAIEAMESFADQSVREDRESRWISVSDAVPEIQDEGESHLVLCVGWKSTHPDIKQYDLLRWVRLEKPDLKDSRGRDILYGWSKRWWDTNPDLYSIHFWQPLPSPTH